MKLKSIHLVICGLIQGKWPVNTAVAGHALQDWSYMVDPQGPFKRA